MEHYAYGQQPSDITASQLALGWARGIRHLRSLSAGGSYWHAHDELQVLFCIRGEFTYEFKERPPVVLTAGHAIAIPSKTLHRHMWAIDPAGHRIEILLSSSRPTAGRYALMSDRTVRQLLGKLTQRTFTAIRCSRSVSERFVALDNLAQTAHARNLSEVEKVLVRSLLCQTLVDIADTDRVAQQPRQETRLMSSAVAWLKQHFAEEVRLQRLVTYMGYSRARFFVLFKQHTGLTPSAWLAGYRIKRACAMLTETDKSVAETAAACGFSSAQYFCSAFRRLTGKTPLEWKACASDSAPPISNSRVPPFTMSE